MKTKIKIKGRLDKTWSTRFENMNITYEGNNTILSGDVRDESALHGILNFIRDLNLKLISVNTNDEEYNTNT